MKEFIKVLWVENDPTIIKSYPLEAEEYGLQLCAYKCWDEAKIALEKDYKTWSAIILDGKCKQHKDSADNAVVFLAAALKDIALYASKFNHIIPWYVLSGQGEDAISDSINEDRLLWDGDWTNKKFYAKDKDEVTLYQRILNISSKSKVIQIKKRYADELHLCSKHSETLVKIALLIDDNVTNDETVFNSMRDVLEWVVNYGKEHGAFSNEVKTPATAATFVGRVQNNDLMPIYVRYAFIACNEITQNGSHSSNVGNSICVKDHVHNNIAPHLIRSTFELLMVILDWCGKLPLENSAINALQALSNAIHINYPPMIGVLQQDEHNNYFIEDEVTLDKCIIDYKTANETLTINQKIRVNRPIANIRSQTLSLYPFFGKDIDKL